MTDDLVTRLLAAIEAKDAKARAVRCPAEWHVGNGSEEWNSPEMVYMWPPEFHTPYEQDKHWRGLQTDGTEMAEHIADNDPADVLRGCAADRKILNLHLPHRAGGYVDCLTCRVPYVPEDEAEAWPCDTIRALAERYRLDTGRT
ncbi:MAG TPA: DUF6221 family protein [Pseudonocardiaceae bacterium]|jgi:hypothetical protein|nr:DUF6221 family protein [Pseudonocardiaceae bacterium]